MMREILFRAKAINRRPDREYRTNYKDGDWVYGLVSELHDEEFHEKYPYSPATMTNEVGVRDIDVDYKTIGQYTGLNDKNGNKIFEGDIVEILLSGKHGIGIVEYGKSGISAYVAMSHSVYSNYVLNKSDNFIVLGNIYDNPELIGGDE